MTDLELRKFIISNSPIQVKWCYNIILSITILFIVDVMVVQIYI